jgi:hypothetical protein
MEAFMPSITDSGVLEAKRRAKNYWNVDGLPTLVIGLFFLLFAGIAQMPEWLRGWLVLPLLWTVVYEFLDHTIVLRLKERFTYPRTGYVVSQEERERPSPLIKLSLNQEQTRKRAGLQDAWQPSVTTATIAVLLVVPIVIWAMAGLRPWIDTSWFGASFFVLLGAVRLKALRRDKLACIDVFGFVLAAVAIAILPSLRGILLFLAPGIVLTTRGAITLLRYVRRNPVAQS